MRDALGLSHCFGVLAQRKTRWLLVDVVLNPRGQAVCVIKTAQGHTWRSVIPCVVINVRSTLVTERPIRPVRCLDDRHVIRTFHDIECRRWHTHESTRRPLLAHTAIAHGERLAGFDLIPNFSAQAATGSHEIPAISRTSASVINLRSPANEWLAGLWSI